MRLLFTVFWRGLRDHRKQLWIFIPCSLFLSALWIIEPLYGRYAIDTVLAIGPNITVPELLKLLGIWLGIYLVINVTQGSVFFLRWKLQEALLTRTRETYFDRLLALDIRHHVQAKSGELMKTIDNGADAAVDLSRQIFMELSISALTSLIFYVISFMVSWQLATIAMMMLPIYLVMLWFTMRFTRTYSQSIRQRYVQAIGRAYDASANIFTVKSSAGEERERDSMKQLHAIAIADARKKDRIWAILEGVGFFMILRILLTGVGIYLYTRGTITLGSLFFFQFSFFRLVVPFEMFGNMAPRWNDRFSQLQAAEALLQTKIDVENPPYAKRLDHVKGDIEIRDLSFSYGDIDTIQSLSLSIRAGEHIALVGHSGAGKSTLAMLLNRFYDPTSGAILVDGVDLRELDLHWWRRQIGLVLQENITFNDTILENIRYSRPEATMEEVIDAAKRASAHDFITKLPQRYESMVGERGIKLSGGERQRVAIARAILKRPSIVVLDEATSALDSITEQDVQRGIKELIAGRTAVIIAHRLSTVRAVDRTAVLENGKLIAFAPHDELMKTCGVYKQMVDLQNQGLLAE